MKTFVCLTVLTLVLSLSAYLQRNEGLHHGEHEITVPHYLSGAPLHQILLDCQRTEVGYGFHAREFSYLMDYLDLQAMALFVKHGGAHYLSSVKYLLLFFLMLATWWWLRAGLGLPRVTCTLLLLALFSSPAIFYFGSFHRSAKIGAAVGIALLFSLCYFTLRSNRITFTRALAILLLSLAITFLDSQGFYLLLVGCSLLLMLRWLGLQRGALPLFGLLTAPALAHAIYRGGIGLWLTERVVGYRPESFLRIPLAEVMGHPVRAFQAGSRVALEHMNFSFGNFGELPTLLLVMGIVLSPLLRWKRDSEQRETARAMLFANSSVTLAVLLMIVLMTEKFPVMRTPALTRSYYPLVSIVIIFIGLSFFVQTVARYCHQGVVPMNLLLAIMVTSNLKALPEHKRVIDGGHGGHGASPHVAERISVLRHWEDPHFPVPPPIKDDPVYQAIVTKLRLSAEL